MSRFWRVVWIPAGTFSRTLPVSQRPKGAVRGPEGVFSTPDDLRARHCRRVSRGQAMRRWRRKAAINRPQSVSYCGSCTTVPATNALIQHKGVPPALHHHTGFSPIHPGDRPQKRPPIFTTFFADKSAEPWLNAACASGSPRNALRSYRESGVGSMRRVWVLPAREKTAPRPAARQCRIAISVFLSFCAPRA